MKKILLILVAALLVLSVGNAAAFCLGAGASYTFGNDFYKFDYSTSSSGDFSATNTCVIPVGSYLAAHLLLGEKYAMLDVGAGFAGDIIPIFIGGISKYFDLFGGLVSIGSGGVITYFIMPARVEPGSYWLLQTKMLEVEVNLPILPVSAYVSGGLEMPMVFYTDPNKNMAFGFGWVVEAGARVYLWK